MVWVGSGKKSDWPLSTRNRDQATVPEMTARPPAAAALARPEVEANAPSSWERLVRPI